MLSAKRHRRLRKELSHFFHSLSLFFLAGYDMAYGWPETLKLLNSELSEDLKQWLKLPDAESLVSLLERLAMQFPVTSCRTWFSVLRELYVSGSPLNEAVGNIALTLSEEHLRELDCHCRTLPTKINILMLLFFLPPVMILLFVPLITEMMRILPG
ncbi:MAG: hypothetical protein HY537_02705 [Deltaproteobacteria bacterium]|nr:hypothetical protein [Deltaproteobacteria bacterium]